MTLLTDTLNAITAIDKELYKKTRDEWDGIAHPTGSLGELEEISIKLGAIQDRVIPSAKRRALIVMAGDNGVFEENVSSGYSDLTSQLVYSMAVGKTAAANMCKETNTDLYIVDMGTRREIDHPNVLHFRQNSETKNFYKEPAMSEEEAIKAIETGIYMVDELSKKGIEVFGTGELGIANTTTSAAVLSGLTGISAEKTCGLGGGLTTEGLLKKIKVVGESCDKYFKKDRSPLHVLACVGGYDIAGLVGVFLGAAKNKKAVVIDGFISAVAALTAVYMKEEVKDYILPSHKSNEKQVSLVFDKLGIESVLDLKMRLGEGTGCMLLFKLLDTSIYLLQNMGRYEEIEILDNVLVNIRDKND